MQASTAEMEDKELDSKIQTRISAEAYEWLRMEAARRGARVTIGQIITELVGSRSGANAAKWPLEIVEAMAETAVGARLKQR